MKNKSLKCTVGVLAVLMIALSACAVRETSAPVAPVEDKDKTQLIEVPPAEKNDEPEADEQDENSAEDGENGSAEAITTESAKPFWQSESSRQLNNLIAIAAAGQADYKVNGARDGWMSKGGRLYGYYAGKYITTDDLVEDGYLESGLEASQYIILLLDGADLNNVEGASVPQGSMNYTVFAALKQSDKYLIASAEGKAGLISEANYNALMASYSQSHGQVLRLSSASEEYGRILNYIGLFEGRFEEYFVREIRKDNKHAVVVFSSKTDTSDIREYILENNNNFWEVVVPNAQNEYYPIYAINRYVPDLNVELLPVYNLASWRGTVVARQGGAEAALFSARAITDVDEIAYQCATTNCAYAVLTNGSRYACIKEDGVWRAQGVRSDYEATRFFLQETGINYGFLVLDD